MTFRLAAQEWMLDGDTLEEKFAFAQTVGFDGIELGSGRRRRLRGPRRRATRGARGRRRDAQRRRAAHLRSWAISIPTAGALAIEELAGFLRTLAHAGAAGIVCPNSFGVFSTKLPPFEPPRPDEDSRALLVDALRQALAASADVDAVIYLEPLNRYEDYLIHTLADATSIVDELDDSRVRVIADTFHMSVEETDLGRAIRDAGNRIAHVQLGDSNRLEPGAGHYDWAETLTALDDIGYDGWLAMECGLSGPPAEVLPRVSRLLNR